MREREREEESKGKEEQKNKIRYGKKWIEDERTTLPDFHVIKPNCPFPLKVMIIFLRY